MDDWRSLGSIARQFWAELVSLDFKSRAQRRRALPIRAGSRPNSSPAGGARYLSPLKLYFLAAALFFLVAPRVTDFTFERQMALDWTASSGRRSSSAWRRRGMSRELFAERFNRRTSRPSTRSLRSSACSRSP